MTPSSSPPPSQTPILQISTISRIFVWNTLRQKKLEASMPEAPARPPSPEASSSSAPSTPKRRKQHHVECSSGSELKTHSLLLDCNPKCRKSDVIVHQDVFVCLNAVDTERLLLLSRRRVLGKVELLGGNALIEERWTCTICKNRSRRGDIYRVSIIYQGTPARASLPDPQKPVATTEAKGVPGLMTITSRQ